MNFKKLEIAGCYLIETVTYKDQRGSFIKIYHEDTFLEQALHFDCKEEFLSISRRNVLRGMHFQAPPAEHDKMVYCLQGNVLDGFVDLRKGSPSYMKSQIIRLSDKGINILFLPKGIAHGFYSLTDDSVMVYKTSSVHDESNDLGILWSSCGITWPTSTPILSDRDRKFPTLHQFDSPFFFHEK